MGIDSLQGTKFSLHNIVLYDSFGSLLRDYRRWRNLTQEKLAELVKVGVRELRNWEADYRRPSTDNLHDISEVTGIPMQVCVALNVNQPIWYSLRKRMFMYSSMEEEYFYSPELFKQYKNRDNYASLEKVTIAKDRHIDMIHSCHQDLYGSEKLLQRNVIKAAARILPDYNKIFFDCWGHYVGHQVCLPINMEVYQELKKQRTIEDYLTREMIVDIISLGGGVFFYYSTFAVNISISSELTSYGFHVLNKIKHKKRYLLASHTVTRESAIIQKHLGLKLAKVFEYHSAEDCPKIHETELEIHMRLNGSVGSAAKQFAKKNLNESTMRRTKQVWSPAIQQINQEILPSQKKQSLVEIVQPCALTVDNNTNALKVDIFSLNRREQKYQKKLKTQTYKSKVNIETCPNTICTLYGKSGKTNISSNGTYRSKDGSILRRFICKECGKSFCSRTQSIFYGLRSPEEKILEAIRLLVSGSSLRGVGEIIGVQSRTVRSWLKAAAEQAELNERVNSMLIKELKVTQIELEDLWAFAKNKSICQRHICG